MKLFLCVYKAAIFLDFISKIVTLNMTILNIQNFSDDFSLTFYNLSKDTHIYLNLSNFAWEINYSVEISHNLTIENLGLNNSLFFKNEIIVKNSSTFKITNIDLYFEKNNEMKIAFRIEPNSHFFLQVLFFLI